MHAISTRRWHYLRVSPIAVGCLTLAGFLLLLPAAAQATSRPLSAEFSLIGNNGYLVSVVSEQDEVAINVSSGQMKSTSVVETTYTAPAESSRNGIEAHIGAFGVISLRFVPSGEVVTKKRSKLPKGCKAPRKIVRRKGVFVGTMRFEGEEGYTTVNATEVAGSIGTPEGVFCSSFIQESGRGRHNRAGVLPPSLYLSATTAHNALRFVAAVQGRHRQRASFFASANERKGAVSILRWVSVAASRSDFKFDRRLTMADVTPPPPFSGRAAFNRRPKGASPSWAGSLDVSFLGASRVPLTGSNFTTSVLERF